MLRSLGVLATLAAMVLSAILPGCGSDEGGPRAQAPMTAAPAADSAPAEPGYAMPAPMAPESKAVPGDRLFADPIGNAEGAAAEPQEGQGPGKAGDRYAMIEEAPFLRVATNPLSTFSIDVDTASYSKVRSYLLEHRMLPPPDAVRIEELINYFDYSYEGPGDSHPFAVHLESAECPWKTTNRLVRIGIQAKKLDDTPRRANLVFLVDVSGSMDAPNKLPLVKRGLQMLVRQLGENDKISIVVYAGAAGLVLPPTSGQNQAEILAALERLQAGGSTNGGQGIQLAYRLAEENKIEGGVNRVILCSDGDFNVGVTNTGELVELASQRAKGGIYLTVLGFGIGNHNDAMLEALADKANGNYGFVDSDREAHKILVEQMSGTLVTVAQDVKIQVEFNPAQVAGYRLIGYENRRLADRDFNDDTKDAGEIGAGHSVTALYEVVPIGQADSLVGEVDELKYQTPKGKDAEGAGDEGVAATGGEKAQADDLSSELLTVKLRYQPPGGGKSTLITAPLEDSDQRFGQASTDFQFATSIAAFGMLLRGSQHRGDATYDGVLEIASASLGDDKHGYRDEFLNLVRAAKGFNAERVGASGEEPKQWDHGVAPMPVRSSYVAPGRFGTEEPPAFAATIASLRYRLPSGFVVGAAFGGGAVLLVIAVGLFMLARHRTRIIDADWPELPSPKFVAKGERGA